MAKIKQDKRKVQDITLSHEILDWIPHEFSGILECESKVKTMPTRESERAYRLRQIIIPVRRRAKLPKGNMVFEAADNKYIRYSEPNLPKKYIELATKGRCKIPILADSKDLDSKLKTFQEFYTKYQEIHKDCFGEKGAGVFSEEEAPDFETRRNRISKLEKKYEPIFKEWEKFGRPKTHLIKSVNGVINGEFASDDFF